MDINQKKVLPKDDNALLGSLTASKLSTKYLEMASAPKWETPTDTKANIKITMISERLGTRVILSVKVCTFKRSSSIAVLSAFNQLSIFSFLPIPKSNTAIQILATTISTNTIPP